MPIGDKTPVIDQACQLQGTVEPFQSLGQAVVAIGADGCVKDMLGSLRECNEDLIAVTHHG